MNRLFFGKSERAVEFIAKTGIMIAVAIVGQVLAGMFSGGQQVVVGSTVNMLLLISVMANGMLGGAVVAISTPFIGFALGISQNITLVPFIAIANLIFICSFILVSKGMRVDFSLKLTALSNSIRGLFSVLVSAVLKFLFLYFVALQLILPLIMTVPEPLYIMFGAIQLLTATVGGVLAYLVAYPLTRAKVL